MRAEKEKQRGEVVCRELCAEIIGVWMSGLGLDAAVGDLAIWRHSLAGGKSHMSVAVDPGLAALVSAGVVKHGLWGAHPPVDQLSLPTMLSSGTLPGRAPQTPPGGCTSHCGLPRLPWVSCTPQLGHCCGSRRVNLLCEPGVPGQDWASQHPSYQPGAAGTAFLGSSWSLLGAQAEICSPFLPWGAQGCSARSRV